MLGVPAVNIVIPAKAGIHRSGPCSCRRHSLYRPKRESSDKARSAQLRRMRLDGAAGSFASGLQRGSAATKCRFFAPLPSAVLKITPCASFPRKRESTGLGPRFRGGDKGGDFHSLGWAAGPWKLRRKSRGEKKRKFLAFRQVTHSPLQGSHT
jgi:hypothetical protein